MKSSYLFQHAVHHQWDTGALLGDTVHQVIVVPHVHLDLGLHLVWMNGWDAGGSGLLGGGGSRDCRLLFCKENIGGETMNGCNKYTMEILSRFCYSCLIYSKYSKLVT